MSWQDNSLDEAAAFVWTLTPQRTGRLCQALILDPDTIFELRIVPRLRRDVSTSEYG